MAKEDKYTIKRMAAFIIKHGRMYATINGKKKHYKEMYKKDIVAFTATDLRDFFSIRITLNDQQLGAMGLTLFKDYSAQTGITKRYEMSMELLLEINNQLANGVQKEEIKRTRYVNGALKEVFDINAAKRFLDPEYCTLIKGELDEEDIGAIKRLIEATAREDEGVVYTTYQNRYGIFSKDKTKGRLFADNPSVQGLPKYMRKEVLKGNDLTDIDIVNCHPSIFYYIAHKYVGVYVDETFSALSQYVKNPKAVREQIADELGITYEKAKELMLVVSYGSEFKLGYAAYTITNRTEKDLKDSFILKYKKELEKISDYLVKDKKHIKFLTTSPRLSKKTKISEKTSSIIQMYESIIIDEVEKQLKKIGYDVSVRMFDGVIIHGHISQKNIDLINKEIKKNVQKAFETEWPVNIKIEIKDTWSKK